MKQKVIIATLALAAMVGCNKANNQTDHPTSESIVEFSAQSISTRTTQMEVEGKTIDAWTSTDKIGIWTSGLDTESINVPYIATTTKPSATTGFKHVDPEQVILYPFAPKSDITFNAYYPYTKDGLEIKYSDDDPTEITDIYTRVDITNQKVNGLGSVDFMTATETWSMSKDNSETPIAFKFKHQLSKLVFNVIFKDEAKLTEKSVVKTTLSDIIPTAYYSTLGTDFYANNEDVDNRKTIEINNEITGLNQGQITAIIHPLDFQSELEIIIDGKSFKTKLKDAPYSGKIYTFNLTVGRGKIVINSNKIEDWDPVNGSDINSEYEGDGSRNNPFKIYTQEQLEEIGLEFDGNPFTADKHYVLMSDIVLYDVTTDAILLNNANGEKGFTGSFNGNGHTITNPGSTELLEGDYKFALFTKIATNGEVKNLNFKFEGITVSGDIQITAVARESYGTVDKCETEGIINTTNIFDYGYDTNQTYVSLLGTNRKGALIRRCRNTAYIHTKNGWKLYSGDAKNDENEDFD